MDTSRQDTLCLWLILILLIGFSINGCSDSEDDEDLIDEGAEPLVVTIIDKWSDDPPVPERSEAEILADKILQRETEDFYFDLPQRKQLASEIERVLSLIRAAYPLMNGIHAAEHDIPGELWVFLEPDFYEIVENMIQDKQGPFRFETGYADFDALNAKLGVQVVKLGPARTSSLVFFYDKRLNLRVASEAYSMVKGVRRVSILHHFGIGADIKAFKQGETWYVIFLNAWGDCPAGCTYHELLCFTVRGIDVEMIPTTQAQTMPPFQELEAIQRDRGPHNATPFVNVTPFFNGTAHAWSWWDNYRSWEYGAVPHGDYNNLGCPLFGEIEAFPNLLSVSRGYRVETLPREDRFFDDYDFTGVVLLLVATQERIVIGNYEAHSTVVASKVVRVAKIAAEIESPEHVYFENVLMPINPPPLSSRFERWWGGVHPTFVVCWDRPEIGLRAYQFIEPNIMDASTDEAMNEHGCDKIRDTDYIQTLDVSFGVSSPLLEAYGDEVYDDIDEVLPRPAAPE